MLGDNENLVQGSMIQVLGVEKFYTESLQVFWYDSGEWFYQNLVNYGSLTI